MKNNNNNDINRRDDNNNNNSNQQLPQQHESEPAAASEVAARKKRSRRTGNSNNSSKNKNSVMNRTMQQRQQDRAATPSAFPMMKQEETTMTKHQQGQPKPATANPHDNDDYDNNDNDHDKDDNHDDELKMPSNKRQGDANVPNAAASATATRNAVRSMRDVSVAGPTISAGPANASIAARRPSSSAANNSSSATTTRQSNPPWLLERLIDHLRQIWAASELGEDETPIDVQKAVNVLEASAGNVPLAAQLYWDDFIANHAAQAVAAAAQLQQMQQQHLSAAADGTTTTRKESNTRNSGGGGHGGESEHSRETDPEEDDGDDDEEVVVDHADGVGVGGVEVNDVPDVDAIRRVRRRLDDAFVEIANANDGRPNPAARPEMHVPAVAAAALANLPDGPLDAAAAAAAAEEALAQRDRLVLLPMDAESVSVSDDEAATGASAWRMVGRLVAQMDDTTSASWADRDFIPQQQHPRPPPLPRQRELVSQQQEQQQQQKLTEDETTRPSQDDQAMFEAVQQLLQEKLGSSAVRPPIDLLWGGMGSNLRVSDGGDGANDGGGSSNVIAAEDDSPSETTGTSNTGVPRTWLSAGFHLSSCGTGLVLKPPPKDELTFWRQQQQQHRSSGGQSRLVCPPPYHCRAITGILSIVTALLYSGASIQGDEVNCNSSRTPFAELSSTERAQQFESRLADALSALLFIASRASLQRKKKALMTMMNQNQTKWSDTVREMQRKVHLCPTCWWEKDVNTGEPRLPPEGRDVAAAQRIQFSVSWTNLQDLPTYVLSNLRCFMSRGGCALLLETILRIHGRSVISHLLKQQQAARKQQQQQRRPQAESLITCTCEERQKVLLQQSKLTAGRRSDDRNKLLGDATPPGHECLSIELLSLLLTGEIHSTFDGWDIDHLGIGILSNNHRSDQIGWLLRHPQRPVWILRGPTCYSVLWHKEEHKDIVAARKNQIQVDDIPGQVLELNHWNCWYVGRNHSELRLMTCRGKWVPPQLKGDGTNSDSRKNAAAAARTTTAKVNQTVAGILERRKLQQQQQLQRNRGRVISRDDDVLHHSHTDSEEGRGEDGDDVVVDEQVLDRIRIHPDDIKYYPKSYKLCRFDIGEDNDNDNFTMYEDRKPRGEHWTPFYRLSHRQRRLVQIKLGPRIAPILETRWPQSMILKFIPEEGSFPIV